MIAESICIDPTVPPDLGKTVFFKFTSFNLRQMQEEDLANVPAYPYTITGHALGLLTPAHATYRPTSNPLTAIDAGTSATIDIAAFSMRIPGINDIEYSSGSISGLAYNALFYVYTDDPTFSGGAVIYEATTDKETALAGAGREFIGSISTPVAGGINTKGNNDGGSGAQIGFLPFIYPTTLLGQTVNSPAVLNNVNNCFDANTSTYADLICTADGINNGTIDFSLYNFTPTIGPFQSVTFNCLYAIPTNTLSSGGSFSIQLTGPVIGTVTIASFTGTGTVPLTPVSYTLPNGINPGQLQVNIAYSVGAANASGGVFEVQLFEAGWLEATQ